MLLNDHLNCLVNDRETARYSKTWRRYKVIMMTHAKDQIVNLPNLISLIRTLNQITEMGSRLDSWGDFIIYSTMAICAWILWPEIIQQEKFYFILIVLSFTLPVLIGFIKFHTVSSYHTWSVKLAVAITVVSYILLFTELLDWPFRVAAIFCLYAAMEEIAITLLIRHELVDIRTVWQALKYKKNNQ